MRHLRFLQHISLLLLFACGCHEISIAQAPPDADDLLLTSCMEQLNTQKLKDADKIGILFQVGLIHNKKGANDSARYYLTKARDLPGGREFQAGRISVNIGNSYVYQGKYVEALKHYLEALQISDKHDNLSGQSNIVRAMANISETYYLIGNHSQALYYAEQAYERYATLKLNGVGYILPQIYYIIGAVHLDREELELAEDYMLKAYQTADDLYQIQLNSGGILIYKSYGMEGLAKVYLIRKAYDKALDYAHKAITFAQEDGYKMVRAKAYATLSDIYLAKGEYDNSKESALKAIEISPTAIELNPNLAFNIAVTQMFSGDREQAYTFFQRYSNQVKQNTDHSFRETIASMEIQYETEKKEMQIALLEKEKHLYTWMGIGGILFAITLGVVLWQNIRNTRKEKQLIAARSVMDGEMKERTRLARDLHDRLSGNLSAVKIEMSHVESLFDITRKLDYCIDEVRHVAHNLMPTSLQYGIKIALEDFATQFTNVHFHFFGEEKRIEDRIEFVIYCCANELVNNSLKHSAAGNIDLQLIQEDKYISLTVQDDGRGYDEKVTSKGMGLRNIHDRVTSCNGKIDISSSPDKGTETTIQIRIKKV